VLPEQLDFFVGRRVVGEVDDDIVSVVDVSVCDVGERGNMVGSAGVAAGLGGNVGFLEVDTPDSENGLGTAWPTPATNNRFLAVLVRGCTAR